MLPSSSVVSNRHVHDGSSGHPARVSERQHVAQRRNKAPQRHEDVPQGQPPRGESCSCIAGVRVSRPNFSAPWGRTKL